MPGPLLVVTVDRLPAWILPAYGATWVAMPVVSGLAARGLVLDGLVATADEPGETTRALLGWLADRAGRGAAVVTDEPSITGMLRGCDTTVVPGGPCAGVATDEAATHLSRLFAAAAGRARERRDDVLWCHASSLGVCWDAPDEFREAYLDPDDPPPPSGAAVPDFIVTTDTDPDLVTGLRHVFAGQLTLLDRCLGRLVAAVGDSVGILVVGLRGMPLGLHARVGPGAAAPHGELVHLPAILVDAAGRMAGQRFGGLAIPADLGATLADLAGGATVSLADAPWQGRSLAGLFEAWRESGRDRVITTTPTGIAVTTPGWRLLAPSPADDGGRRPRLYARPDDFFEQCDVADRSAAVCEELARVADAARRGRVAEAWGMPLSAETTRSG